MNIGICGIGGRMGQAVFRVVLDRGHVLSAAFDADTAPCMGTDTAEMIPGNGGKVKVRTINGVDIKNSDVIIDFSSPAASLRLLSAAIAADRPVVLGTTGFTAADKEKIEQAAKKVPVVMSPNMSAGVNLLFKLTEMAAGALDESFDVEIFEAHHKFKKDAPSGTAGKLVEIIKQSSTALAQARDVHGREGMTGERSSNEIGILAMRGGDIVGEHTVFFAGMGERIELTHRAISREPLARGAVRAAEFIMGKAPGLYSMYDVLGIA